MKRFLIGVLASAVLTLPVFAALKQGDKAPDFSARASLAGKEFDFSLKDALKKGPVVVYFYPSILYYQSLKCLFYLCLKKDSTFNM